MSDQEHPHAKCAEALDRMIFFIDNEVDQIDHDAIAQHLEDCAPCLGEYDVERTVKAIVARSCSEHAPEALRDRVLFHLRAARITLLSDEPS